MDNYFTREAEIMNIVHVYDLNKDYFRIFIRGAFSKLSLFKYEAISFYV